MTAQLGMVGLGRMGLQIKERIMRAGHSVVGFDLDPLASDVESLTDLVDALSRPRILWLMLPSGEPTNLVISALPDHLDPGDIVIDGGNSRWSDALTHSQQLAESGIDFLDVGVSGGVWGAEEGFALMVGGDANTVKKLEPIFSALTPPGPSGFVHAGGIGAGHFAKMVHNGIEYGVMQAYAEGYEVLQASSVVNDPGAILGSWQEGTVIRSWLLELLVRALTTDPELIHVKGYAEDSGEGRWMVETAIDHAVPLPVISAALFARFASRQDDSPAMKVIAALRNQFGGHAVTSSAGSVEKGADAPGADTAPPQE
jgi:6-phosphogluconate dehydrogenase